MLEYSEESRSFSIDVNSAKNFNTLIRDKASITSAVLFYATTSEIFLFDKFI